MKFLSIVLFVFLMTSCAPIYVTHDYEKQTDFSKYKTYNYYADIETGFNDLDTNRLLDALDEQLKLKGLALAENPDFFIDITSAEFQNGQRSTVGVGVGGGGRNVGGGISIGVPIIGQAQPNRQIVFLFRDANGDRLFWQAVSESSFNINSTPEKKEERLRAIVTKVLKGFPPKK